MQADDLEDLAERVKEMQNESNKGSRYGPFQPALGPDDMASLKWLIRVARRLRYRRVGNNKRTIERVSTIECGVNLWVRVKTAFASEGEEGAAAVSGNELSVYCLLYAIQLHETIVRNESKMQVRPPPPRTRPPH